METNEFVVRDMKEFTQTVKDDTSKLVAKTATSMKEQLNIKVVPLLLEQKQIVLLNVI